MPWTESSNLLPAASSRAADREASSGGAGQGDLRRLPGSPDVPPLRPGDRRAAWHLGRNDGQGAAPTRSRHPLLTQSTTSDVDRSPLETLLRSSAASPRRSATPAGRGSRHRAGRPAWSEAGTPNAEVAPAPGHAVAVEVGQQGQHVLAGGTQQITDLGHGQTVGLVERLTQASSG